MQTEKKRTRHPFHMHEAIVAQPEAFAHTLERNAAAVEELAAEISSCERLFLVGIGTSHHAARVGEQLFRVYGGGLDARALHSFDFALYGPDLAREDCVVAVSHRGTKRYTGLALERAREAGSKTALVTGDGGASEDAAGTIFRTVAQEESSAHTVSYTSAISVLAALAGRVGLHRTGDATLPEKLLREEIPVMLEAALQTETEVEELAREHVERRRIWLAGGGPSAVTAGEIALKIKETSYLQAEGMATEAMLHGPFQCVENSDLFVLIAPAGAAQQRTAELAEAVEEVGAPFVVIGDATSEEMVHNTAGRVFVPEVPEPFGALTCAVPLQLFAYHLALARGTNPDGFRTEDERFARIKASVRL